MTDPLPPSSPPFLLFRVQDALHGAHVRENGLYLPYRRDGVFGEHRNTSHWTVNSLVSDHAYGSFNRASDGSLKGAIVVVADPRDLPTPAGLGQVDTWFRMDAVEQPDGSLARGLSVGPHAVVIAPDGVAVPDGITVRRYDGTIGQRDATVATVARERGITMRSAGMWGWVGESASSDWSATVAREHYPEAVAQGRLHLGAHADSVDDRIENGAQIPALVERFATERLFDQDDGSQVGMVDVIRQRMDRQRTVIDSALEAMDPAQRARTGAFYTERLRALDRLDAHVSTIDARWKEVSSQAAKRAIEERLTGRTAPAAASTVAPALVPADLSALPPGVVPPPLPMDRAPALPGSTMAPPPLPAWSNGGWLPRGLTPAAIDRWSDQRTTGTTTPSSGQESSPGPEVRRRTGPG